MLAPNRSGRDNREVLESGSPLPVWEFIEVSLHRLLQLLFLLLGVCLDAPPLFFRDCLPNHAFRFMKQRIALFPVGDSTLKMFC